MRNFADWCEMHWDEQSAVLFMFHLYVKQTVSVTKCPWMPVTAPWKTLEYLKCIIFFLKIINIFIYRLEYFLFHSAFARRHQFILCDDNSHLIYTYGGAFFLSVVIPLYTSQRSTSADHLYFYPRALCLLKSHTRNSLVGGTMGLRTMTTNKKLLSEKLLRYFV